PRTVDLAAASASRAEQVPLDGGDVERATVRIAEGTVSGLALRHGVGVKERAARRDREDRARTAYRARADQDVPVGIQAHPVHVALVHAESVDHAVRREGAIVRDPI